jgi:hypothetical protein
MRTDQSSTSALVELTRLQIQAERTERRLAGLAHRLGLAAETPMVTTAAPATRFGITAVLLLAAAVFLLL